MQKDIEQQVLEHIAKMERGEETSEEAMFWIGQLVSKLILNDALKNQDILIIMSRMIEFMTNISDVAHG